MATLSHPRDIPLHLNILVTRKGLWLIEVDSVTASSQSEEVSLQLHLRGLDDDRPQSPRRLYAVVRQSALHNPQHRTVIADRIRTWIETREGHGYLLISPTT